MYAGAKVATTNFSRALAVELGADRIRVNMIAPDTSPAKITNADPEDLQRLAELGPGALENMIKVYVPLQEQTPMDDLVNGVLFLASDCHVRSPARRCTSTAAPVPRWAS